MKKELTKEAFKDAETEAKAIGSVPEEKEDLVTALSQAFKDGIRVGSAISSINETA